MNNVSQRAQDQLQKSTFVSKNINQTHLNISQYSANSNLNQTNKTFRFCQRYFYIILIFIYSISSLSLSTFSVYYFQTNSSSKNNQLQLELLVNNWNQYIITDLDVVKLSAQEQIEQKISQCKPGYDYIFTIDIPQIDEACICQGKLSKSLCNQQQIKQGCNSIKPIKSKKAYQLVDKNGNIFAVCGKKVALSFSSIGNQLICPVECGARPEGTKVCVSLASECPITYISFENNKNIKDIQSIAVSNDLIIYFSKKEPLLPISEIKITLGEGVCLQNNKQNFPEKYKSEEYQIFDSEQVQYCEEIDRRFIQIFQTNFQQILKWNYLSETYQNIPIFQTLQKENYSVFVRNYLPWKPECRKEYLGDVLNHFQDQSALADSCIAQLVCSAFYFILIGLLYNFCSLLNLLNKRIQNQVQFQKEQSEKTTNVFSKIWVKILFTSAQLVSIVINFIFAIDFKLFLDKMRIQQCGDQQTQDLFSQLYQQINQKISPLIISNFTYFMIVLVVEVFSGIIICSKKFTQNEKIEISKKYIQTQQPQLQQNSFQVPEYQAYNIYAGNGINTTIHPIVNNQNNMLTNQQFNKENNMNTSQFGAKQDFQGLNNSQMLMHSVKVKNSTPFVSPNNKNNTVFKTKQNQQREQNEESTPKQLHLEQMQEKILQQQIQQQQQIIQSQEQQLKMYKSNPIVHEQIKKSNNTIVFETNKTQNYKTQEKDKFEDNLEEFNNKYHQNNTFYVNQSVLFQNQKYGKNDQEVEYSESKQEEEDNRLPHYCSNYD